MVIKYKCNSLPISGLFIINGDNKKASRFVNAFFTFMRDGKGLFSIVRVNFYFNKLSNIIINNTLKLNPKIQVLFCITFNHYIHSSDNYLFYFKNVT